MLAAGAMLTYAIFTLLAHPCDSMRDELLAKSTLEAGLEWQQVSGFVTGIGLAARCCKPLASHLGGWILCQTMNLLREGNNLYCHGANLYCHGP